MGFTFTLLKGKINVMSEMNLLMIVYNLKRMISIMGLDEFKRKLASLSVPLFAYLEFIKTKLQAIWGHENFRTKFLKPNYQTI